MIRSKKRAGLLQMIVLALLSALGNARGQENPFPNSMMYTCQTKPFLSASVSSPRRDSVPRTEIKLTAPSKGQQGAIASGKRIPRSWYRVVIENPEIRKGSLGHAAEVCGAEEGIYTINVYEHGDELYRLAVHVVGKDDSIALLVKLRSQEGRTRKFRFLLKGQKGKIDLNWLDEKGQPELDAAYNDW